MPRFDSPKLEVRKSIPKDSDTKASLKIVRNGPFLAIAFVTGTIFMTRAGTRATLVPLQADEVLGWGPGEIGLIFTVTGLMTLFTLWPAAWAIENINQRFSDSFSGLAAGIGTFVISFSAAPLWFVIGNLILTLGTGTAGPAPAAFVADLFPERRAGYRSLPFCRRRRFCCEATSFGLAKRHSVDVDRFSNCWVLVAAAGVVSS